MTFLLFSYFVIKCWWISREQAWTLSWPIYLNLINDTPNIQNTIGGVHSSKWNLLLSSLIYYHFITHLSKLIYLLGVCKTQRPWTFKTIETQCSVSKNRGENKLPRFFFRQELQQWHCITKSHNRTASK